MEILDDGIDSMVCFSSLTFNIYD